MYDVGRTRSSHAYHLYLRVPRPADHVFTQCTAWYPYFNGVNVIISLTLISCFDKKLVEDQCMN